MGGWWSWMVSSPTTYSDSTDSSWSSEDEEEILESTDQMDLHNRISQRLRDEPDNCFDSATDAVGTSKHVSTMSITVTLDEILFIEEQVDLYEKVSLIYLLYDDPQVALQDLIKLLNGSSEKLLRNWAILQNQQSRKWKEKFIEAICIIQNYQILRKLGYQKKDLMEYFLPHHMFTTICVNKMRKALYMLCEDLTEPETQKILDLVYSDFKNREFEFKMFQSTYLELFLLHWETVGYITQDCLNNLYTILKQLEYYDTIDNLKRIIPSSIVSTVKVGNTERVEKTNKTVDANQKKKPPKIFEKILNGGSLSDFSTLEESLDNTASSNENNKYKIDIENPGICLIINQESFYTEIDPQYKDLLPPQENKLEPRLGTEKDKQNLETTFKMFNFKTVSADNLHHTEILPKIRKVIQSVTNESSLFVCIMSHGGEGVIYGVNSCRVSVRKIQNLMCSVNRKNMAGKPKVLILQSCQGTQCQKISSDDDPFDDITTDSPSSSNNQEVVPPLADLFTFWATVPGYGAIRNKKTGTWFIQSLCDKMKELGNVDHLEDICTSVVGAVSSKKWDRKEEGVAAMVPLKDSTFRKRFYLPPIRRDE